MAQTLYQVATWLVPLVIAIVFHEVAHGWVARFFGDPTAGQRGRLSLNPVRHVDPVGTVILPMGLALAGIPIFGWARPVPVDKRRLRNPRLGRYGLPLIILLVVVLPMISPQANLLPRLIGPPIDWILNLGTRYLSLFG